MEACHVLLESPWKFDKKTIHDGLTNKITFIHNQNKFVLHPLSPSQVLEDQVQMKKLIKKGSEKHRIKNNSVPIVMYLCFTFYKHTLTLEDNFCRVIFFSNFLWI